MILRTTWLLLLAALSLPNLAQRQSYAEASEANDPRKIWQNLEPYRVDEDTSKVLGRFPADFEFGLATASSHVEDDLDDSWLEFSKRGGVRGFEGVFEPERRLNFFSDPLTEIRLASEAGAKVFRISVNWGRLVPVRPEPCQTNICTRTLQNTEALNRYKEIFQLIKDHNMKIMLTLFHHDLPKWAIPTYTADSYNELGWLNKNLVRHFHDYAVALIAELGDQVDYLITFNEPTLFSLLTHVLDHWPSGKEFPANQNREFVFNRLVSIKEFFTSMDHITLAHKLVYESIKGSHPDIDIGVSHLTPYIRDSLKASNILLAHLYDYAIVYGFPDNIINHLDFLGINYYGEERLRLFDLSIQEAINFMYSDSGRILNAGGLYTILNNFHNRYKKSHPDLKYFITENGIADDTDLVRMPFLIEHLYAAQHARSQGVPLKGYIFWTISDNWEWADGYCPKFGLVHVDRDNNLARTLKPSYYLFQSVTQSYHITQAMRDYAHGSLHKAQERRKQDLSFADEWDGMRGFCRDSDGIQGKDRPTRYPFHWTKNWLFVPE